nr:hypothetical protein [uncultured Cohaesibacter sp.]
MMIRVIGIIFSILLSSHVLANSPPELRDADLQDLLVSVDEWLEADIVYRGVRLQNEKYTKLTLEEIQAMDKEWRAETQSDQQPVILTMLRKPLSIYLMRMQSESKGMFVEIFVMDQRGLNVGTAMVTTDLWQGDEAKFEKTVKVGADAIYVGEPSWDDTYHFWRAQVNKSLVDPISKRVIGAATVEVNLTEFMRRQSFKK